VQLQRKLARALAAPESHRREIFMPVALDPDTDDDALAAAVDRVVARHAMLRSVFAPGDTGFLVGPAPERPRLARQSWPIASGDTAAVAERLDAASRRRPDLWQGPLADFELVTLADGPRLLLVHLDHYVADRYSVDIVLRDIRQAYESVRGGREPAAPSDAATFCDFSAWQWSLLESPAGDALRTFWAGYLAGAAPSVDLAPGTPVRSGYDGESLLQPLTVAQGRLVAAAARARRVTPFTYWLTCLTAVVAARVDVPDLVVNGVAANRHRQRFAETVGYLSHGLLYRQRVDLGATFAGQLGATRATVLTVLRHADLPYAEVIRGTWPDQYLKPPSIPRLYLDLTAPGPPPRDGQPSEGTPTQSDPGFNVWVQPATDDSVSLLALHDRRLDTPTARGLLRAVAALAVDAARRPDEALRVLVEAAASAEVLEEPVDLG
jgi:hypothetical protein